MANATRSLAKQGEDEAINNKIRQCHEIYVKKGKKGLIELVIKLYIEVRRLSLSIEARNKELEELRGG